MIVSQFITIRRYRIPCARTTGTVDGDPITVIQLTTTQHGTLSLNADGTFTYTPNAGYVGSDSFTYKLNDGAGQPGRDGFH